MIFPVPKPSKREKKAPKAPNKTNPARMRKRFLANFGGKEYRAWIVAMPCAVCGVDGYSAPAHVVPRSVGGTAEDLVPLCRTWGAAVGCHYTYDEEPWNLPEGTEERLKRLASELRARWMKDNPSKEGK